MELREAIDKLFEMTDEQREKLFGFSEVGDVLDVYHTEPIIRHIEEFCKPKYGDVYLDKNGRKIIVLNNSSALCEDYECPQNLSTEFIMTFCTKTDKNIADKLKGLFE